MKGLTLCLLSVFIFVTGCYSAEGGADSYTWDFGKVKKGEILKHGFLLKNESGKILNILSVNTSCGCAASEVQKKRLAPEESTTIGVTFKTQGYSGLTQQYIYVNTDDLDNPIIRYIIKADVGGGI